MPADAGLVIRFWGTRGSLPKAADSAMIQDKLKAALRQAAGRRFDDDDALERFIREELPFSVSHTFGGNSPCVQIAAGEDEELICDLGSGARELGNHILAERGSPRTYHVLMSHMHWDHIMGFPFFVPAFIPGNTIHIHGCHAGLEEAFRRQHGPPSFPVPFDALGADIHFHVMPAGQPLDIAGFRVTGHLQLHGGDSYGYRIERGGKSVVYSTDSEHKHGDEAALAEVAAFFKDADLVIFDAMYSLADTVSVKEDWGHSSNIMGVELCHRAHARHLCMFHHEPVNDDATLYRLLQETRRYEEISRRKHPLHVSSAYDGLEIRL